MGPVGHRRRQRPEVALAPALKRHGHSFADPPARVAGVRAKLAERIRIALGEQRAEPDHPAEGEELPAAAGGCRLRVERRPTPQLRGVAHLRRRETQFDVPARPRQARVLEQTGLRVVEHAERAGVVLDLGHVSAARS